MKTPNTIDINPERKVPWMSAGVGAISGLVLGVSLFSGNPPDPMSAPLENPSNTLISLESVAPSSDRIIPTIVTIAGIPNGESVVHIEEEINYLSMLPDSQRVSPADQDMMRRIRDAIAQQSSHGDYLEPGYSEIIQYMNSPDYTVEDFADITIELAKETEYVTQSGTFNPKMLLISLVGRMINIENQKKRDRESNII